MKQKEMSYLLKILSIFTILACLVFMFVALPFLAQSYLNATQASSLYWPFLVISWLGLAPIIVLAILAWGIFTEIGSDNSFCEKNAARLRLMSYLSAFCVVVWIAGVVFIVLSGIIAVGIILSFTVALAIMLVLAIVCACLSHLTVKAAFIKQENDLTV
ncbi:MAG: DUF2975 domain-containing protein [Eggerthellaceae bacterium]|nr:DUF2975 domain-containing protein [Eggerthellaceae bacterium]